MFAESTAADTNTNSGMKSSSNNNNNNNNNRNNSNNNNNESGMKLIRKSIDDEEYAVRDKKARTRTRTDLI